VRALSVALGLFLACVSAACSSATLTHGGQDRHYEVVVPDGFARPGPVLFVLHGGTRSGADIRRLTGFDKVGAQRGFATVFPDGLGNQWNDARRAPDSQLSEDIDDVGFLKGLAAKLVSDGIADPARIYATGMSNGGMMTFRLACEAADTFAAFAPVIANLPADAEAGCRPLRPVPMVIISGTQDRLVLWQGGPVAGMLPGDRGRTLSSSRTAAIFGERIGKCAEAASEAGLTLQDGSGITPIRHSYNGCAGDIQVVLYEMQGMGHRWPQARSTHLAGPVGELMGTAPRDFPANRIIWDFLRRFSLP